MTIINAIICHSLWVFFLPAISLYTYNSLLTIKSIKTPELFLVFVWSVGGHYSLHYSLR